MSRHPLETAQPPVRRWFEAAFERPTRAQELGWPAIASGESTLLLAPTGSGKTLTAFLFALDRLLFAPRAEDARGVRVLYVSPLKALGADIERNLHAPIAGITAEAQRGGDAVHPVTVGMRTGDTPQAERQRMLRHPPDVLITTPESLYLLLTSKARETLATVETVIVDEIHSMVPTKRGAHLALSLERLAALPGRSGALQRIGLSATQRPAEEAARLLAGGEPGADGSWTPRAVTIADAGSRRAVELSIEVPVEDMARLGEGAPAPAPAQATSAEPAEALEDDVEEGAPWSDDEELPVGNASQPPRRPSIWPSLHPRLVELIRAHRSTMVFVNSRRLAERLAAALNDLAGEELALAHHGSVAKDKRAAIEDRLKRGSLPAIVATSSLELGIDMGAVDLVVQVEAPPSVASGLQRVGRAGHSAGEVSRGVVFPKYRGDLVACAAVATRVLAGEVEATRHARNPLDVLAQQMVAEVAMGDTTVDALFDLVRRAAPWAELPRSAFDDLLDMLTGRHQSEGLSGLRPRLVWDRLTGALTPRRGAQRVAIVNGGTIPDRGLYGVFLAGDEGRTSRRVGELDEEMVYEARTGDVFQLGASSWRILEITHDRVLVEPAPGEAGTLPFWRGDGPGRNAELGEAIGRLVREVDAAEPEAAAARLREEAGLTERAAENLLAWVASQREALGEVPSDRLVVVESFLDEIGDWRVCLLSPYGSRVHAPWCIAVQARLEQRLGLAVDSMHTDDGIVFRLPEADAPPELELFLPSPDEVEDLVVGKLADTALFAARFRENAARALLLPRRNPGQRTPLWAQRRRSADLLEVALRQRDFPLVLETFRECLQDVFDLPSLRRVLDGVRTRRIRAVSRTTRSASPFAAALLFPWVGGMVYDGDASPAEWRARALHLDPARLRELLGEDELRTLFTPEDLLALEDRLQRREPRRRARHEDMLHDLLLELGPLTRAELEERSDGGEEGGVDDWLARLLAARRVIEIRIAGEERVAAAEDAGRLRDALGVPPPPGLPVAFLEGVAAPLEDLVARFARTHGPFPATVPAEGLGLGVDPVLQVLRALEQRGRVVRGAFLPGGTDEEWCDVDALRALKRSGLARLRAEVEPVEPAAFGRFLPAWQGLRPEGPQRHGLDGLLETIEQLQGCPIPASDLEAEVLPARVVGYRPSMLDELCAAGEVVWQGVESLGTSDGRVALYLTDHHRLLAPVPRTAEGPHAEAIRALLAERGALFFADLAAATQAYPPELANALWQLVFAGEVTNDTLAPLRSLRYAETSKRSRRLSRRGSAGLAGTPSFRSRRIGPPGTEGRWSLVPSAVEEARSLQTDRRTALARQLLDRYGVLVREAAGAEGVSGGFGAVYPVLRALEEGGRVRRGWFVEGLGAAQFALPGAEERLREAPEGDEADLLLAATDPAQPFGSLVPWPSRERGARPQRAAGAQVLLRGGRLIAWIGRSERSVLTFPAEHEPVRSQDLAAIARTLAGLVDEGGRRALLVQKVDGEAPGASPLGPHLEAEGFLTSHDGLLRRAQPR